MDVCSAVVKVCTKGNSILLVTYLNQGNYYPIFVYRYDCSELTRTRAKEGSLVHDEGKYYCLITVAVIDLNAHMHGQRRRISMLSSYASGGGGFLVWVGVDG